jgi:hypothetical protein
VLPLDDKAMNPDDQAKQKTEALLQRQQRRQQWLREASRFHTKNLFGLWFLTVLAICVPVFAALLHEEFSLVGPISILLVLLVVLTGAYVFQEVARIHRRIDALLKLLEDEG